MYIYFYIQPQNYNLLLTFSILTISLYRMTDLVEIPANPTLPPMDPDPPKTAGFNLTALIICKSVIKRFSSG